MAFSVQEFRSALGYDGARPNLFRVELVFPASLSVNTGTNQRFSLLCKAASLPGITHGTASTDYFGTEVKLPGDPVFDDWTVSLYNDEDMENKKSLEKWMGAIRSHGLNVRSPSMINSAGYSVNAKVVQFGKRGEDDIIGRYNFIGLYPNRLDPIGLDWGENNRIQEFSVTFSYQWWEDGEGAVLGQP